jgi:hypothetical protein
MQNGLWDQEGRDPANSQSFARFAYPSAVASSADQTVVVDNATHSIRIVCGDIPSPEPVADLQAEKEDTENAGAADDTESESNTESETESESESETESETARKKKQKNATEKDIDLL